MTLLKAALLDDNPEQLLKNQQFLEKMLGISVVTACVSAEVFVREVKQSQPDVFFLT